MHSELRAALSSLLVVACLAPERAAWAWSCRDANRPACAMSRAPFETQRRVALAPSPLPTLTRTSLPVNEAGPRLRWVLVPPVTIPWTLRDQHPPQYGELSSYWETFIADMDQRDCIGNLCGPQSLTLRVGLTDLTVAPTAVSPILGVAGGSAGALATAIKPGPPHQPTAGPSRDGLLAPPRGLWRTGPRIGFTPLVSIENHLGGLRVEANW